jgi:hypothetical protein
MILFFEKLFISCHYDVLGDTSVLMMWHVYIGFFLYIFYDVDICMIFE